MSCFPLLRKSRLSNEHIMTGVFGVALLYLLPAWIYSPVEIITFILVLISALFIDVAANYIRYKRPVCAVSAAVTAGILQVLTPGVPLWGRLLGIMIALIIGKHIWGGTGKNVFNPAITGLLFLSILFKISLSLLPNSVWLLPAIILSLPFILYRPFAAIGVMAGMTLSLLFHQHLTISAFITYGIIFWGCLVATDPATTTPVPFAGLSDGFLVGFLPLYFTNSTTAMALAFLIANLIWYLFGVNGPIIKGIHFSRPLKIRKAIPFNEEKTGFADLAGRASITPENDNETLSCEEILERIQNNEVFGFGGAAFPTIKKIRSAMTANVSDKYFIINGVECDPGLIHDQWLIRKFPAEIEKGIEAVCRCIPLKKTVLAVKHRDGLRFSGDLKIIQVPDNYPAGAEKILIGTVLKKEIAADLVPANAGILILNIQTVYAIYEAVYLNRKADTRYLTVSNLKTVENRVVRVKLGEKLETVIYKLSMSSNLIFSGGGLMQSHLAADGEAVDRATNFIAVADFPRYKESPLCSGCSLCMMHCPAKLKVAKIAELTTAANMEAVLIYHPEKCMNCGSCSYVCPAGRNLAVKIKEAADYAKNMED